MMGSDGRGENSEQVRKTANNFGILSLPTEAHLYNANYFRTDKYHYNRGSWDYGLDFMWETDLTRTRTAGWLFNLTPTLEALLRSCPYNDFDIWGQDMSTVPKIAAPRVEKITEVEQVKSLKVPCSSIIQFVEMIDRCIVLFTLSSADVFRTEINGVKTAGLSLGIRTFMVQLPPEIEPINYGYTGGAVGVKVTDLPLGSYIIIQPIIDEPAPNNFLEQMCDSMAEFIQGKVEGEETVFVVEINLMCPGVERLMAPLPGQNVRSLVFSMTSDEIKSDAVQNLVSTIDKNIRLKWFQATWTRAFSMGIYKEQYGPEGSSRGLRPPSTSMLP